MKIKSWLGCLLLVSLAADLGCNAPVTSFVAEGAVSRQVVRSELEVFGSDNRLVLLAGSYVPKLSVLGYNNRITVERGAAVARVELAGEGNEVQTAQGMPIVATQWGSNAVEAPNTGR